MPEIASKLQQGDETLKKVRDQDIDIKRTRGKNSSYYRVKDNILYRIYQQENSDNTVEQVDGIGT